MAPLPEEVPAIVQASAASSQNVLIELDPIAGELVDLKLLSRTERFLPLELLPVQLS